MIAPIAHPSPFRFTRTLLLGLLALSPFSSLAEEKKTELADKSELYTSRKGAFANPKSDHPDRPNILIIGDSISIGYTPFVRQSLQSEADLYRIATNGRDTGYGLEHLDQWLRAKPGQWDIIHFNWGLWDLCYRHPESKAQGHRDKVNGTLTTSLDDYRTNLEAIVTRLKETGATLIWASTTPVPAGEAGRKVGDDLQYNQVAAEVMKTHGIFIDDLHGQALKKLPQIAIREGDVHFTKEGYHFLAAQVTRELNSALESKTAPSDSSKSY